MKLQHIVICFYVAVGLNVSLLAMDEPSGESNPNIPVATSNSLGVVKDGLGIFATFMMIALNIKPFYQLITTGSSSSNDVVYEKHELVAFKQQEEDNRIRLSKGAMDVCWSNVQKIEHAIALMPEGENKENMIQSLHEAQKNCAYLVQHHSRMLVIIPEAVDGPCDGSSCSH